MRSTAILTLLLLPLLTACGEVTEEENTVKIGEFSSYTALPVYAENFRRGWQLAVAEKNARGGLLGRKIEVVDRDDHGQASKAMMIVEDLLLREEVDILSGCLFAQICLAVSEYAEKNNIFHMKWFSHWPDEYKRESDTSFSTFSGIVQAKAAARHMAEAAADPWVSISPNHAFGLTTVKAFAEAMTEYGKQSFKWRKQFWNNFGKLDAGSTVNAAKNVDPAYILNTTLASDLVGFIREAEKRGLNKNTQVVSIETGMPEVLNTLAKAMPEGWVVTGYPPEEVNKPEHKQFVTRYRKMFDRLPGWMSLLGYIHYQFIFAAVEEAQSLDDKALVSAMENLAIQTPLGTVTMREADHVSTLGVWVGRTALVDDSPKLVDWQYYPGSDLLINQEKVGK